MLPSKKQSEIMEQKGEKENERIKRIERKN